MNSFLNFSDQQHPRSSDSETELRGFEILLALELQIWRHCAHCSAVRCLHS